MLNQDMAPPAGLPDVGRLFSETWRLYKARIFPLFLIGGIGALGSLASVIVPLIAAFMLTLHSPGSALLIWPLAGLLSLSAVLWIVSWAQVAMMEAVMDPAGDKGALGYYRAGSGKVILFSWVCILFFVFTLGGLFLLVLPGVFLGVALVFSPFVCLAEGLGGMESLERSLAYARGRWFALFGRGLLIAAASYLPSLVPIIGPILGAFSAPLGLIAIAVLYESLRAADGGAPFVASSKKKLLIAASALGFVIPAWLALRAIPLIRQMMPIFQMQARYMMEHPEKLGDPQKWLSSLQGGLTSETAASALDAMRQAGALPSLQLAEFLAQLQSPDPQVRRSAAQALGAMGDPRALPALKDLALRASPAERDAVLEAIARLEGGPVGPPQP